MKPNNYAKNPYRAGRNSQSSRLLDGKWLCYTCQNHKPIEDYVIHKSGRWEGLPLKHCVACGSKKKPEVSKEILERVEKFCSCCRNVLPRAMWTIRGDGAWAGLCKPCNARKAKARRDRQSGEVKWKANRKSRLKTIFGLTLEDYDLILEKQGGVCGVCRREKPGERIYNFAVDHCHSTGKIRGLLCTRCNIAMGGFRDDPEVISRAIDYLQGKMPWQ